jgi:micrococcal nuclease
MKVWANVFFLLVFCGSAHAATVESCNDGDTCRIMQDGRVFKVRLLGIDAPELDQPFGQESRDFLLSLLSGKELRLDCHGQSGRREACAIFVGSTDIQLEMVKAGWAVDSPRHSGGKYGPAEHEAKRKGLGMWKSKDLLSPHCWRLRQTPECVQNNLYQP